MSTLETFGLRVFFVLAWFVIACSAFTACVLLWLWISAVLAH
jgi:hypothetical protein